MPPPSRVLPNRLLACTLALSACAAPPPATLALDGVYAGTRTQVSGTPGCAPTGPIRFQVAGAHIWVHSRHPHRGLDGSIADDGQLSLRDPRGSLLVTGVMTGTRLTATETPSHPDQAAFASPTNQCVVRIEATRTSTPGTPQDE